jgi:hypothetical protein
MTKWKQAVVFGSLGVGAFLLITGKRPAGIAAATVGLAVLATEYPEKFERIWESAPEYLYRGTQIFSSLSRIAERFAGEAAQRSMPEAATEAGSEYLT